MPRNKYKEYSHIKEYGIKMKAIDVFLGEKLVMDFRKISNS